MGSRGAFIDVNMGNFTFKESGQIYHSIGNLSTDNNVKILVKKEGSVKAPDYSHSPNRIYATIQNGQLKHLTFYDDSHKQQTSIDLMHYHRGVKPHVHIGLNHDFDSPGISPTDKQLKLIAKIKKEFKLKWEKMNMKH